MLMTRYGPILLNFNYNLIKTCITDFFVLLYYDLYIVHPPTQKAFYIPLVKRRRKSGIYLGRSNC